MQDLYTAESLKGWPERVLNPNDFSYCFDRKSEVRIAGLVGDLAVAEKFLDDSERLYGEPHPTRHCVRSSRRIVVKVPSLLTFHSASIATPCLLFSRMTTDAATILLRCLNTC